MLGALTYKEACSTGFLRSWHALCSSAGEASAPDDVLWLMARAGYKPVIDSCGGKCIILKLMNFMRFMRS